jgi:hypothetical protein
MKHITSAKTNIIERKGERGNMLNAYRTQICVEYTNSTLLSGYLENVDGSGSDFFHTTFSWRNSP